LLSALAAIELASPGACELVFSYRPLQLWTRIGLGGDREIRLQDLMPFVLEKNEFGFFLGFRKHKGRTGAPQQLITLFSKAFAHFLSKTVRVIKSPPKVWVRLSWCTNLMYGPCFEIYRGGGRFFFNPSIFFLWTYTLCRRKKWRHDKIDFSILVSLS
jgi:hypothetical protein